MNMVYLYLPIPSLIYSSNVCRFSRIRIYTDFVKVIPMLLTECVFPKFLCSNLTFTVMIGGGVFGRWLVHGGTTLMNGNNALIKEARENCVTPSALWEHKEKSQPGRGPSPNHAGTLILNFQPPELWEMFTIKPQSVVFCYSSPNRLRHYVFSWFGLLV